MPGRAVVVSRSEGLCCSLPADLCGQASMCYVRMLLRYVRQQVLLPIPRGYKIFQSRELLRRWAACWSGRLRARSGRARCCKSPARCALSWRLSLGSRASRPIRQCPRRCLGNPASCCGLDPTDSQMHDTKSGFPACMPMFQSAPLWSLQAPCACSGLLVTASRGLQVPSQSALRAADRADLECAIAAAGAEPRSLPPCFVKHVVPGCRCHCLPLSASCLGCFSMHTCTGGSHA